MSTIKILWSESDSATVTISSGATASTGFTVGGAAVTFPYALSADTAFDTELRGTFTISVKLNGVEIAATPDGTRTVELVGSTTLVFSPSADTAERSSTTAGTGRGATLTNWRQAYGTDPTTAKIAIVGDSTAEETNYPWPYSRLRTYHMQSGQALGGMQTSNLIEGGNSGYSLDSWLTGPPGDFTPANLWAAAPNLIIYRWGTNDMRLGATTQAQMTTRLRTLVDLTRAMLPNTDIVLAVPPTFTTTVVGQDFLSGASLATAQARSDALRNAHLSMRNYRPNVVVWDAAADLWGTRVNATSPLMVDQLHPNQRGQERWADLLAELIGTERKRPSAIAANAYRTYYFGKSASSGNGFIDIDALDDSGPYAKEWALTTSDILHIPGFASSPVTLSSATFPASGNAVRILKSVDFTAVATGTMVAIVGTHAPHGQQEGRIQVTVDPGSVAAASSGTPGELDVAVTVTGATTDCGVVVQPPTATMVSGLAIGAAWVSAANTVTVRLLNNSGSAIDPASGTWKFWLTR